MQADAERDVADLRDAGIGQQPLDVGLEYRDDCRYEHRGQRQREQDHAGVARIEDDGLAEDREEVAHQHVDRHLGGGRRKEGRHRGRRVGVGVGQPQVQREQRDLQRDADGDEGQRCQRRPRIAHRRQPHRQVRKIQCAGLQIQQADADHVQGGADGAHQQVLVGRHQRPAVATHRDQHVGRQRRDLEEHEQIEGVAGQQDAEQARQAQHHHRVEEIMLLRTDFRTDATAAVGHHEHADQRHDEGNEGVGGVDPVFDTERRRPIADGVRDHAFRDGACEQRQRDRQRRDARQRRHQPARERASQQYDNRRRKQRHHHQQDGKMLAQQGLSYDLWISVHRLHRARGFPPPRYCRRLP